MDGKVFGLGRPIITVVQPAMQLSADDISASHTLDGDCPSIALAINSKSQIVGQSFNCDTNTLRAVLWENGSIIDLNVAIPEPLNINDRGEIAGVGLPPGCDDENICGHEFLLIPCAGGQGCEGSDNVGARTGSPAITTSAVTSAERRRMTKEFVARWRARLGKSYHIPLSRTIRN